MAGGPRLAFYAALSLGVGFFAGRQSTAIDLLFIGPSPTARWSSLAAGTAAALLDAPSAKSLSANRGGTIRLHERIEITENAELFHDTFRPRVEAVLREGNSKLASCPPSDVKPYLDILHNLQNNPRHYEDDNVNIANDDDDDNCPLVFLFYYEAGTQILQRWMEYYRNIESKRCLKFLTPRRYRNTTETIRLRELGYELIGPNAVKQDKVINLSLDGLQKDRRNRYGSDVLVSVNDLDHLLAWFGGQGSNANDTERGPHRYSTYSDMVFLYVYELLSTSIEGCGNQLVAERFAVPCTCMLEDNERYISNAEVVYSEYGVNNKFHPTSNFYLRGRPEKIPPNDWTTGTVFANLRGFDRNAITHHIIGTHKKVRSRAAHAGVLHYRSDSYLSTTTKYMHFLVNNGLFSNSQATVEDVLFCSTGKPSELILDKKRCRSVKEIANIIAVVHQKRLCLSSGYSEEHCRNELTCCITEQGWPA